MAIAAPLGSHEETSAPGDRGAKRRPFSTLIKKLANFKHGGSSNDVVSGVKGNGSQRKLNLKKNGSKGDGPSPNDQEQTVISTQDHSTPGRDSLSSLPATSPSTVSNPHGSMRASEDGIPPSTIGNKSTVATISTDHARSVAAASHAPSSGEATLATMAAGQAADSTFSSPAPSVRSLSTTLTTIQSAATGVNSTQAVQASNHQFTHQFPSSPAPSALPPHLAPQALSSGGHPQTYNTATANNLLTDNASILTLASSSKRRRRRSMDTDASVRALAPSSLFGGSRESLPLSVLSATAGAETPGIHAATGRPSMQLPNERASIYSATGVAPALPSERNSYYAGKLEGGKEAAGSVKSGFFGHARNDSVTGSVAGGTHTGGAIVSPGSPLAPRERGPSRRGSTRGVDDGDDDSPSNVSASNATSQGIGISSATTTADIEDPQGPIAAPTGGAATGAIDGGAETEGRIHPVKTQH